MQKEMFLKSHNNHMNFNFTLFQKSGSVTQTSQWVGNGKYSISLEFILLVLFQLLSNNPGAWADYSEPD